MIYPLYGFAEPIAKTYPWIEYDPSAAPAIEKIKPGCGALSMDPAVAKKYEPNFPADGFKKRTSGYAVFDFQIDSLGNPKNIELVAVTSKAHTSFENQSLRALKKLKFNLSEEWLNSCLAQKYRIGYAYRLLSDCTYTEFPKPIINVCVTGIMEVIPDR